MPAAKSGKAREAAIELAKQGHSVRAIEEILARRKITYGKSAIAELVKLYRSGKGPSPKASTPKASTPKASAPKASAPSKPTRPTPPVSSSGDEDEAAPVALPGRAPGDAAPFSAAEVADLDLEQLAQLAALFNRTLRSALSEGDTRVAGWTLEARITVAKEIAKLRPPTIPDPDKDPANVAARDELRDRLDSAVRALQGSPAGLAQLRAHVAAAEEAAARRGEVVPPAVSE